MPEIWLTRAELAERWKLSPRTLANWSSAGKGPQFTKITGSRVLYALADVEEFENRS